VWGYELRRECMSLEAIDGTFELLRDGDSGQVFSVFVLDLSDN